MAIFNSYVEWSEGTFQYLNGAEKQLEKPIDQGYPFSSN